MNFMTRIIDYANGDQERSQKVRFALNVPLLHANYDVLSRCLMSEVFSSYNFFTNSDDITAFTRRRDAEQFIPLFKERKNIICLVFTPDGDPSRNREATDAWKALGCPIVLIQPAYHQGSAENVQRQKNIVLSDGPDHETLSLNAHLMACRVAKRHAFRFHCNAGKAYLSVSCEGDIYPCARFIGSPDYSLGTVFTDIGTAQARYIERNVQSMDTCRTCWARTICGGGCMFHLHTVSGSINTPDVQWCTSYKEQIEQSISTYYSLPPDRRKRLHEQMQIQQFCDYL
jgi:radical SAM protein with 4Fe4S-binding SPASM domain